MIAKNARGQVIRIFSYGGQMRKHGGDVAQRNAHAGLDTVAGRAVRYSGPGYRVRKARG